MTRRRSLPVLTALLLAVPVLAIAGPSAPSVADEPGEAPTSTIVEHRYQTSDGVELQTTLTSPSGQMGLPTVVEFSPYGDGSGTLDAGPDYNYLLIQLRGTGDSDGQFDALGPRSQKDVVEVLDWACNQPFSNGHLALAGFSASAIILFNSWHQELPCVDAAMLRSGTHELYRDLLTPGGLSNLVPGAAVIGMIGAPALAQGADRLMRDPASALDLLAGLFTAGVSAGLLHPNLDGFWRERGWRGDANDIPVLLVNGFFDVESRGSFAGYRALRADGAHLLMAGGHDGAPAGTDNGVGEAKAWFDHYVRGVNNGVEQHPRVQLLMSNGDRVGYLKGDYVRHTGADWPLPGTQWTDLSLDPAKSGSGSSTNQGSLTTGTPAKQATQSYLTAPSVPTMTDVPNAAIIGAMGVDALTSGFPLLSDTMLAELTGLTYTTAPLADDVALAGPVTLDVPLSTTTYGSGIWAVLSDVAPDGSSHPLTVGRLSTRFPDVIEAKSIVEGGRIVQPYGDYTNPKFALPGQWRRYQVEMWPVGNVFQKGHRLRLSLVGSSAASPLALPGLHSVKVGGANGAVLRLPVLPGSDLGAALAQ